MPMDSPFDFSRPPSESERCAARVFLEQKQSILVSLQDQNKVLELQSAAVERTIAQAEYFVSPFRKLFPDVLHMILDECLADDPVCIWRLAGVTSPWKTALLVSPFRWSHIVLHDHRFRKAKNINLRKLKTLAPKNMISSLQRLRTKTLPADVLTFTQLWLDHNGPIFPLNIKINRTPKDKPGIANYWLRREATCLQSALILLLTHIFRWKHFSFGSAEFLRLVTFGPVQAPLLDSMR